jgi:hypothetical protein
LNHTYGNSFGVMVMAPASGNENTGLSPTKVLRSRRTDYIAMQKYVGQLIYFFMLICVK